MEHLATVTVLTVSDSIYQHLRREDISGDTLEHLLREQGFSQVHRAVAPDEREHIRTVLAHAVSEGHELIMTTGGTGIAPRDVTPEATRDVIERELPGMAEAMRAASLAKTKFAMLSRQVAGVRNQTLIVNLPGSPKAVAECFAVIAPVLRHTIDLLHGRTQHQST